MLKFVICVLLLKTVTAQVLYDAYFGKPLTEERNNTLALRNATSPCIIAVRPCKKEEGRRIDGTCVNFKYPSRNGSPTPFLRMLPAHFGMGNTIRPAMDGSELPSARLIRTKILSEGYHTDHHITVLASNLFVQATGDCVDILYIGRYAIVSECCIGNTPNRASPFCISIPVPEDDPFLRRTDIRCLNLTRFTTYQDVGCIPHTLPAERVSVQTPLQDLSVIYGYTEAMGRSIRAFRSGLLLSETADGVERPPPTATTCLVNRRPIENACYAFGDPFGGNSLQGAIMTSLIFYREHNRIARKLAELNPCWDDELLFQTARQINIAQWQHMFFYELMAAVLERVLSFLQEASDVSSSDIQRGRDQGIPPYNAYRKICGLPVAHKWEDFKEIRDDKVEQLRRLYHDVDEVELMPAIYAEKHMDGAFVGPTLFCIMTHQLVQWRKSDRHFYEHGDIPTALTLPQLNEIRKMSVARLMCDSGAGVTKIQPHALLNESKDNKITPCKEIPHVDLSHWADPICHKDHGYDHHGAGEEWNFRDDDVHWKRDDEN